MRVQILYFEGCPHHRPTVRLTNEVIAESGVTAEVEEVEVRDQDEAERLRFLGSPSVRVDGLDIEPETTARESFALSCRMYDGSGVPPRDLLVRALSRGAQR